MAAEINEMNEKQFRQELVVPMLKHLGFIDVIESHGPNEFGIDVRFAEYDRFGTKCWYGAQLKVGDITGSVSGPVNDIVTQVETAFDVPFMDLSTKKDTYIAGMYVIVSGRFKDNAKKILIMRLRERINWVYFLDGAQLLSLRRIKYQNVANALRCLIYEIEGNADFAQTVREYSKDTTYLFYSFALDHLKESLKILTPLPQFADLVADLENLRVGLTKCNRALDIIPILIAMRGAESEHEYLKRQVGALTKLLPEVCERVKEVLRQLGP
jgi:hypothetical protein